MPTRGEITNWRQRLAQDRHGEEMSVWLMAVVYVTTREINLLRAEHSLPARTKDQVFSAIRAAAADLTAE